MTSALADAPQDTAAPSAPLIVERAFEHDREPPVEWVTRLEEVSPPSDEIGFLRLVWEPGDPWIPAQRWTLYEMIHPKNVDAEELAELRGPNPRSEGHMCSEKVPKQFQCLCPRKTESWRKGPCALITLTQWKLFQRTGYVGRPFWIIQGTTGGHRNAFTHEESLLLEAEGYPTQAPGIGALPYAPFDERVVRSITRFNRLWQFNNSIREYREAMGPGYATYRRGVEKELRRELVAHLKEQMQDVYGLFLRAADKGELDNQPRTEIDYDRLEQQNEEVFIEQGKMLHHSRMH